MKKTACIIIAILLVACSQTLANFSGGDDFNDNSMDTGKWTNFVSETGTSFTETNGRLEFEATGVGVDRSHAWKWVTNTGSYTNDWIVSVDTVNQLDESLISNGDETWFGLGVYFASFDNGLGIDRNKGNDGSGYHDIVAEGSTAGGSQFIEYKPASSDEIIFSIAFDADTKQLSCSYDQGGGFVVFTNMDVSAWGMTDNDVFELFIYGGSRGVVVGSGDVYADHFIATSSEMFVLNEAAKIYCPSNALAGSWVMGDFTTPDSVMFTFMADGSYFLSHDSSEGFSGGLGMERGTYTWNTNTGVFVANVTVDTNGEGGLSHPNGSSTAIVDGDTLNMVSEFEGTFPFQRVSYPSTPPSIVGGWLHLDAVNNHDNVVFTFLPNGIYFFAQDGDSAFDPSGQDGMERGVYSWDADTGAFSATALVDTCGAWGPDEVTSASVDGNTLTLNGGFDLQRVIDPLCSDLDGDGLPDVWEQQYFSNPTNATAGGHGDGDTLDNRAEYIAGTDPTNGSSVFEVSDPGPSPSGFVLNWLAIEGRVYSVLWTDSLTNGFQTLESNITPPQNSYTDTVHAAEGGGFYNLKVQLEN